MANVIDFVQDDILAWAAGYTGEPFHALLCDPPYHLAGGFMGKAWDGGDIAFRPDTWAALAQHLYPGAFGMAFASSRGWHRMAVAIEDAGLIIHPSIFGWAFGTGFPKATRVKDSPAFDGHRYGLQAMKPALEPIVLFQKPYQGKPVANITQTGAGALWVDGARVGNEITTTIRSGGSGAHGIYGTDERVFERENPPGRWPANLVIQHHPDCNGDCVPGCPVLELGEQSGQLTTNATGPPKTYKGTKGTVYGDYSSVRREMFYLKDSGTAARFFHNSDWNHETQERLESSAPVFYQAKASRAERNGGVAERNGHPTVKPISLTRWLATLLLPPGEYYPKRIMVPFSGSGSEVFGAVWAGWDNVVSIEREAEYMAIQQARWAYWLPRIVADLSQAPA